LATAILRHAVVIADNDGVFVRDPSRLFDLVRRDGALLVTVDEHLGPDDDINGLSPRQAIEVLSFGRSLFLQFRDVDWAIGRQKEISSSAASGRRGSTVLPAPATLS
jgi:hypothetical protein